MLVVVFDKPTSWLKVLPCKLEVEVSPHWDDDVVAAVELLLVDNPLVKFLRFFWGVESSQALISNEWIVLIQSVEAKSWWSPVHGVQSWWKDLDTIAKRVVHGPPYKLHFLVSLSILLVLEVKPSKDEGVEAHFCEESLVSARVTKWINLPANAWFDAKLFQNKLMTEHHVVNHILIVGTCFILHAPARIQQL